MSVADHALALTLALIRDIPGFVAGARGDWDAFRASRPMRPLLTGKRVGIFGLGDIGLLIARRLGGFDVDIAYHNRSPRPGVSYNYRPSVLALAESSDVLIVAAPGGAATRHLVGREVLEALGRPAISSMSAAARSSTRPRWSRHSRPAGWPAPRSMSSRASRSCRKACSVPPISS